MYGHAEVTVKLVVEKHGVVQWTGYRLAVQRLGSALEGGLEAGDEVYIYAAEAMNWLAAIVVADRKGRVAKLPDVRALVFARNRTQHSRASFAEWPADKAAWVWRPANLFPRDDRYRARMSPRMRELEDARERHFNERLAGEPLLDAFRRVAAEAV